MSSRIVAKRREGTANPNEIQNPPSEDERNRTEVSYTERSLEKPREKELEDERNEREEALLVYRRGGREARDEEEQRTAAEGGRSERVAYAKPELKGGERKQATGKGREAGRQSRQDECTQAREASG